MMPLSISCLSLSLSISLVCLCVCVVLSVCSLFWQATPLPSRVLPRSPRGAAATPSPPRSGTGCVPPACAYCPTKCAGVVSRCGGQATTSTTGEWWRTSITCPGATACNTRPASGSSCGWRGRGTCCMSRPSSWDT
jgi:hypothetical protein